MEAGRYLRLFRSGWWVVALAAVVCALGAYLVSTHVLKKQYTASATFEVNIPGAQTGANVNPPSLVATDAQLVTSVPVAQKTVANLQLGTQLTAVNLIKRTTCTPSDLAQTFTCTTTYPDPVTAYRLLNELGRVAIATNNQNQTAQLNPLLGQLDAKIKATQADLARSTSPARVNADTATLSALTQQQVTLQQALAAQTNSIIVLNPAQIPIQPSSPRPLLNTILALIIGLLVGAGAVLVADYLDNSPRDAEHVAQELGAPIYASLPRLSAKSDSLIEVLTNPRSATSESYRMLRTNIRFANVDSPVRSLVVTSGLAGEGKTTTAGNLAVACAEAGMRVILVDADLRRPGVHSLFGADNRSGLTNALISADSESLRSSLRSGPVPSLRILTTGPVPPNPAELLSSHRMHTILQELRSQAELVIVDSPPVLAVADPVVLAAMTDAVIYVSDVEQSSLHVLRRSRQALASVGANITGVVLNKVPLRGSTAYGYYGQGYYSQSGIARPHQGTGSATDRPSVSSS